MAMENKDQMRPLSGSMKDSTVLVSLFAFTYLAVLPMAGTIALRYVALLGLLLLMAWWFPKIRADLRFGLPVTLWACYLVIFPLISDNQAIAWESLVSEWGKGLLAILAGTGAAILFSRRMRGAVFYLGLVSALPILVYLVLFVSKGWVDGSIPWGYWGRELHHADIGYAAGHTVVLMTVTFLVSDKKFRPWAIALIISALLSTVLARSRAGLAFAVLGAILVIIPAYMARITVHRSGLMVGLVAVMLFGAGLAGFAVKDDHRWLDLTSKLSAGFLGSALKIECEGIASIEADIFEKYGKGEISNQVINSVQGGDGARIVLMRAGLELASNHPWGSDGSRQAYQILLKQECPNPAILMAHTHNGWIDMLLAIGWLGAILYLGVLLHYFRFGLTCLRDMQKTSEWALVLTTLSLFWIIRGVTDSVFRDHMLEMQGFVLAFAASGLQLQRKVHSSYSPQLPA